MSLEATARAVKTERGRLGWVCLYVFIVAADPLIKKTAACGVIGGWERGKLPTSQRRLIGMENSDSEHPANQNNFSLLRPWALKWKWDVSTIVAPSIRADDRPVRRLEIWYSQTAHTDPSSL